MKDGKEIKTLLEVNLSQKGDSSGWRLVVTDSQSHVAVVETEFTNEDLNNVLETQPTFVEGTLWQSDCHGKRLETTTKQIKVNWPASSEEWEKELDRVESSLENTDPYWELRRDRFSSHRAKTSGGQCYYNFVLRRWSDAKPEEAGQA